MQTTTKNWDRDYWGSDMARERVGAYDVMLDTVERSQAALADIHEVIPHGFKLADIELLATRIQSAQRTIDRLRTYLQECRRTDAARY